MRILLVALLGEAKRGAEVNVEPPSLRCLAAGGRGAMSGGVAGTATRSLDLDGLRGWASVSVMFFHFTWEMYGPLVPIVRNSLTAMLFNSAFSVALFFVISGESLSVSYWRKRDITGVKRLALKRYPRLTVPIIGCVALTLVVLLTGTRYNVKAGAVVGSPWLSGFLTDSNSNPLKALSFALFDVYYRHPVASSLNPLLWTMRLELAGSFMVFFVLYLDSKGWNRKFVPVLFLAAITAVLVPNATSFLSGLYLSYLRAQGFFDRLQRKPATGPLAAAACLALWVAAGQFQLRGCDSSLVPALLASAAMFALHSNAALTRFFSSRLSVLLGRISFALYLVHFSVLISFASWAALWLAERKLLTLGPITVAILLAAGLSVLLALLFENVEHLTKRVEALVLSTYETTLQRFSA
jgi:peptidoglycan/LPS O-acetylase OafA/YrhL